MRFCIAVPGIQIKSGGWLVCGNQQCVNQLDLQLNSHFCSVWQEHRGFGFVTFETEAAIQRVVTHGSHRLKGSTIAIDIAMPKVIAAAGVYCRHVRQQSCLKLTVV